MAELRKFIKARTGGNTPKSNVKETKRQCRKRWAAQLRRLDHNASFRFLDLPPELQNTIYEHILTHDRSKGSVAYPALLRASPEVYKDGSSILYADSVLELSVLFYLRVNPTGSSYWSITQLKLGSERSRYKSIYDDYDVASQIPALRQIRNIHLHIKLWQLPLGTRRSAVVPNWEQVADVLSKLVKACHSLRYIKLDVEHKRLPSHAGLASLPHIISPLANLPSSCTLELKGLDDHDYDEFWSMANAIDMV